MYQRVIYAGMVGCLFLALGLAQAPDSSGSGRGLTLPASRREQLIRILQGKRPDYRAAQELALAAGRDAEARKAVLAAYVKIARRPKGYQGPWWEPLPYMPFWLADGLAAAEDAVVPDLIGALQAEKPGSSPELCAGLLATIGRIGPKAKMAIPFLRAKLADPQADPGYTATIRVVLANLGDRSPENLAAIVADLNRKEAREAVLQALIFAHGGEWVTESMVRGTGRTLDGDDLSAIVALGLLAERFPSARNLLKELRKGHDLESCWGLALALASARLRLDGQGDELLSFCADGISGDCHGAWLVMTFGYNVFALMNETVAKHLVKLVNDPDVTVCKGALWVLRSAGPAARETVPELLKFVQGKADETCRAYAALVLADIADYSHLAALEAALEREKSAPVRKQLTGTIRGIKKLEFTLDRDLSEDTGETWRNWLLLARYRGMTSDPRAWELFAR